MYREILHLWGPISINSFGLCIALGLALIITLLYYNPLRKQYLTDDQLFQLFFISIVASIIGGRLLFVVEQWLFNYDSIDSGLFWNGGFSVLGSIISCIITLLIYVQWYQKSYAHILDLISCYAPMAQAFGRIGCFMAGCCHGITTSSWFSITYTDTSSFAPLGVALCPTQLISAGLLCCIYLLLRVISPYLKGTPGTVFLLYLFLASLERFFIDFLRADHVAYLHTFSLHQLISLLLAQASLCIFFIHTFRSYWRVPYHESV